MFQGTDLEIFVAMQLFFRINSKYWSKDMHIFKVSKISICTREVFLKTYWHLNF
jgi:hypothetical protein